MAAYMYDRLVTEDEYRQRVRRHRPSSLLPLIAAAAARYGSPQRPQSWLESPSLKYTPWALADAARVCLAYGTEHLRSDATERDLLAILAAYSSLKEPTLHGADEDTIRLRDFMMRLGCEQMGTCSWWTISRQPARKWAEPERQLGRSGSCPNLIRDKQAARCWTVTHPAADESRCRM
jgi:hypothetical protein